MRRSRITAYAAARTDAAFMRAFKVDDWSKRGCICAYCHEPLKRSDVTGDHVLPRSRGGTTNRKNIRSACEDCNRLKRDLSEKAFKKLLAHTPEPGASLLLMLAHVRRRLNLRTERAEKRIRRFVGLKGSASARHN